jgi:flagellar hook-length control protein FliK
MGVKGAEVSSASLEPARLAEAHNQGLTRQISQGVETLVRTGQTSIQIHLQPQDLGRIDLRLTTNGEGTWVTISTEKAATGMLLERQLDELKQTLVNAGVHLNDLSLNTGTGQQGQAQSALRWQQTKTAHAQSKDSDIVDANQAVNLSLIGRTNGSTGVDYRV